MYAFKIFNTFYVIGFNQMWSLFGIPRRDELGNISLIVSKADDNSVGKRN